MSTVDLAALRALAEGATPGPWHVCDEPPDGADSGVASADHDPVAVLMDEWYEIDPEEPTAVHDAAFIAAANPTAILALIERVEAAEGAVERVRGALEEWRAAIESVGTADQDVELVVSQVERALDGPR